MDEYITDRLREQGEALTDEAAEEIRKRDEMLHSFFEFILFEGLEGEFTAGLTYDELSAYEEHFGRGL